MVANGKNKMPSEEKMSVVIFFFVVFFLLGVTTVKILTVLSLWRVLLIRQNSTYNNTSLTNTITGDNRLHVTVA